jgi:hypothetical protein
MRFIGRGLLGEIIGLHRNGDVMGGFAIHGNIVAPMKGLSSKGLPHHGAIFVPA